MSKLIIARHTETIFNRERKFSGQVDIPLSSKGIMQAKKLGSDISGYVVDLVFVSSMVRTIETAAIALQVYYDLHQEKPPVFSNYECKHDLSKYIPIQIDSRLNERSYGICEGIEKDIITKKFGVDTVFSWRRSWDSIPVGGETLRSVCTRILELLDEQIKPKLKDGLNILIICHQNTMRAFKIIIENIQGNEVEKVEFGNGAYIVYENGFLL